MWCDGDDGRHHVPSGAAGNDASWATRACELLQMVELLCKRNKMVQTCLRQYNVLNTLVDVLEEIEQVRPHRPLTPPPPFSSRRWTTCVVNMLLTNQLRPQYAP